MLPDGAGSLSAETLPGLLRAGPFDAVMLYSARARAPDAALRESGLNPRPRLALSLPELADRETLPDGLVCGVAAAPDEENLLRLL